ncbi:hypothetical protein J6590_005445 [Homalodisca vitripennis]|nr:hypothetical protein J6590_005445 [Homalodisca vitripennis]
MLTASTRTTRIRSEDSQDNMFIFSRNAQVAAAGFIVMATIIRKKNNRKSDVNPEDSAGIHLTHSSERGTFEHCSKTDKHTAHLTLCDANAS